MSNFIVDNEKIVGMSANKILEQVKAEHTLALNYVRLKRIDFRDRLKLYNNQRKQRDKIGILTIYSIINTLLAIYYTDEVTANFSGRSPADQLLAGRINKLAMFDNDEMAMAEKNFFTQWDRLFYGVGLRDMSDYDLQTDTPNPITKDPLTWLPDPRGGINPINGNGGFRFYGFEVERNHADMESMGFFDMPSKSAQMPDPETQQTKIARNQAYGLTTVYEDVPDYDAKDYSMIDWYTILKNPEGQMSKYLVTVDQDITKLLRCEEIKPVMKNEKEDISKTPWPLVANYYSPQRNDPFGTSVCDLVEDKQRAKSILANLRITAEKARIYPMYLYNAAKIRNRRDLDFGFNKAIAINNLGKNESLENAVIPFNKVDPNVAITLNNEESLDNEAQISTGADQMQQGVLSDEQRTLGEVQQVTANAQTRLMLGVRVNAWGEKDFWWKWYRLYHQYFSGSRKKVIRMDTGFGVRFDTISRKDFITKESPDIEIVSKVEMAQRKQKKGISLAQKAPYIFQDPTKPQASKNYLLRQMFSMDDMSDDEIQILVPETPDETAARLENELLSRNQYVNIQMEEDHLSHMVVHSAADDTPAKWAHIQAHRLAYIESGQQSQHQQTQQAMMMPQMARQGNMAQAQMGNQQANLGSNQPLTITT